MGLLQFLPAGGIPEPAQLPPQGLILVPGGTVLLLSLGIPVGQLFPGQGPVGLSLLEQTVPFPDQLGPLPLQAGRLEGGALQLLQGLPDLDQLPLQPGDLPHALVHLAFVLPILQPPHGLGEGDLLLSGGHQGGDPPLQLRGGGDRHVPCPQKSGAGEDLLSHTGEQLAAVGPGEAGDGLLRAGVDGGEVPEGRGPLGAPADQDLPALQLQTDLPLHGGPGPGLIAVLVGQVAFPVPLAGIDPIEHGPPEGGPGGFSPLVGGMDQGEAGTGLQPGPLQNTEGGRHGSDLHGHTSSPSSRAARPYRRASWQMGSSGWACSISHMAPRNSPVKLSSPRRAHRSRGRRVRSRRDRL